MKIANINIPGNILLAPMSNVTNLPFRLMCRKYGASLTYSEMISSDAVIYENEKSINRGISCEEERPLGIQIFGNSAENMTEAALRIEEIYSLNYRYKLRMSCKTPDKRRLWVCTSKVT